MEGLKIETPPPQCHGKMVYMPSSRQAVSLGSPPRTEGSDPHAPLKEIPGNVRTELIQSSAIPIFAVVCICSFVITVETPTFSSVFSGALRFTISSSPSITSEMLILITRISSVPKNSTITSLYPGRFAFTFPEETESGRLSTAFPSSSATALILEFDSSINFAPSRGKSSSLSITEIFNSLANINDDRNKKIIPNTFFIGNLLLKSELADAQEVRNHSLRKQRLNKL